MEKNIYLKNNILKIYFINAINLLQEVFLPVTIFLIRLKMARIFWYSGLTKISDWKSTIYLFEHEYRVPFISSSIAAFMSTCIELTMPVFLILGFMTRLATIPLFLMTAVIQFTYLKSEEHIYWALLLGLLICNGPGKLSIDYLIKKKFI